MRKILEVDIGIYDLCVKSLKERVQKELSSQFKALDQKWAMSCLKKNEWHFQSKDSECLCKKLHILHGINTITKKFTSGYLMFAGNLKACHSAQHASTMSMLVHMVSHRLIMEGERLA